MTKWRSFEEARKFARSLKLSGQKEWKQYCKSGKKPDDIPTHPDQNYKTKGWKGMGDWLGTGKLAPGSMRPFKEARAFVQKLNLKDVKEYVQYCQNKLKGFKEKPQDIPLNPGFSYKDEWKGYSDWLGNGRVVYGNWRPFNEARAYVQKLNLKSSTQWLLYCKNKLKGFKEKPRDIPTSPAGAYKDEWKGFSDWLGKKK